MRSLNEGAALAALIILGSLVFCYCNKITKGPGKTSRTSPAVLNRDGNKDSPVLSTDRAYAGTGKVEGIVGQITDSRGRPIVGASIHPRPLDYSSPPIPEIAIVSDSEGRYTWRLFPGMFEISVSAEGFRGITKQATVKRGQQVTIDFTLEPATQKSDK